MKKLHNMYQSRNGSASVPQLNLLMQNWRILHYSYIPLLFLPRWRAKSAFTKNQNLLIAHPEQLIDRMQDKEKESWHTELCYSFFLEYRSYLQHLGFSLLQIEDPQADNAG